MGVSGGRDSMALIRLADRWARARSGRAFALLVDHGLRAAAAAEARLAQDRLRAYAIEAIVLSYEGPRPAGDLQAFARSLRYRMLEAWCHENGVLHLLLAHHREDQAETLLLRLARGSGLFGLAGMAARTDRAACRVLRPLLGLPRARIEATLALLGQAWSDDPSNQNPDFARVQIRQAAPALETLGLGAARLAETAQSLGRTRALLETAIDRLIVETVTLHPAGFAMLDEAALRSAPADLRLRLLGAVLATIGNLDYPPRFERLCRLDAEIWPGSMPDVVPDAGPDASARRFARTLAGCRVARTKAGILVYREAAALPSPLSISFSSTPTDRTATARSHWDRFAVEAVPPSAAVATFQLGPLGQGARRLPGFDPARCLEIPSRLWPVLPALRVGATVVSVPHLGWIEPGGGRGYGVDLAALQLRFCPVRPLCRSGFVAVGAPATPFA